MDFTLHWSLSYLGIERVLHARHDSVDLVRLPEEMLRPLRVAELPVGLGQPDQQARHHPRAVAVVEPDKVTSCQIRALEIPNKSHLHSLTQS